MECKAFFFVCILAIDLFKIIHLSNYKSVSNAFSLRPSRDQSTVRLIDQLSPGSFAPGNLASPALRAAMMGRMQLLLHSYET